MDRIIAIAYNRALRNQRREKTSWFFMSKDFGQDHCRLEQCICSRDLIFQQASGFSSRMEFYQSRTKAPCFYPRNGTGREGFIEAERKEEKKTIIIISLHQFSSMQTTLLLEANVNYELRKSTSVFFRERKFLQMMKKKKKYTLLVRSAATGKRGNGYVGKGGMLEFPPYPPSEVRSV